MTFWLIRSIFVMTRDGVLVLLTRSLWLRVFNTTHMKTLIILLFPTLLSAQSISEIAGTMNENIEGYRKCSKKVEHLYRYGNPPSTAILFPGFYRGKEWGAYESFVMAPLTISAIRNDYYYPNIKYRYYE